MKAEHRHELKTNALAEWIANLPQWTKQNVRTIIVVAAVVTAAAGGYIYFKYQRDVVSVREKLELTRLSSELWQNKKQIVGAQERGQDVSFMLLQLAGRLQTFAARAKDEHRAALALIKAAEALRMELHYGPRTVTEQEKTNRIQDARRDYSLALAKSSSNPSLAASAKFGLGLCEEEIGNFDAAEQIYRQIVLEPSYRSTTSAVQAEQRLEIMSLYKQEVVFKAAPPPRRTPPPPPQAPRRPPGANLFEPNLANIIRPGKKTVVEANGVKVILPTDANRVKVNVRTDANGGGVGGADTNVANP